MGAPKVHEWRPIFLDNLEETGNVSRAAEAAGISRQTAYDSRDRSKEFRKDWDAALDVATDKLEAEARRRAVDGLVRYKFHKGYPVTHPETGEPYYEHEYSDTLLIFLLKAHRPEKFRDRVEHTGADGGPIRHEDVGLTDEERLKRLTAILDRARQAGDRPDSDEPGEAGAGSDGVAE